MRTYGIDFDGVIHSYEKGFHDGSIYGTPIEGSLDSIRMLMGSSSVFIFTARRPLKSVLDWMTNLGFECELDDGEIIFWDVKGKLLITQRKLPAFAYIDDRAVRFYDWDQAIKDLAAIGGEWLTQPNHWKRYAEGGK